MRKHHLLIASVFAMTILAATGLVTARASANPVNPPDSGTLCAVAVDLQYNGKPVVGVPVTVYQVADMGRQGDYFTLTEPFAGSGVDLASVNSAADNVTMAQTLLDHARAGDVTGTMVSTGADGKALFGDLPAGLYLVESGQARGFSSITPYVLTLPELQSDGSWVYDVTALPKTELMAQRADTPSGPSTAHTAQTGGQIVPTPILWVGGGLAAGVGAMLMGGWLWVASCERAGVKHHRALGCQ